MGRTSDTRAGSGWYQMKRMTLDPYPLRQPETTGLVIKRLMSSLNSIGDWVIGGGGAPFVCLFE
jgi:hypothetical protein